MKILFVSEDYFPKTSGVPVVVRYLAEGLTQRGYSVTVLTTLPEGYTVREEIVGGVNVVRFNIHRDIFQRIHGDKKGFCGYVLNNSFDLIIVECGQAVTTDCLTSILSQINSPLVLHAHGLSGLLIKPFIIKTDLFHTIGNTYSWFYMKWYYRKYFKKALSFYNATISLTNCDSGFEYLKQYVKKNYVLSNAADDIFFEAVDNKSHNYSLQTDGKPYIISIANYTVVKNQLQMLEQFYKSVSSDKFALVLIGSQRNSYYEELLARNKELENKYGHKTVQFLTGVDRKVLPSLLDNAKLYLVSSTYEEYSISIIEAMARMVPFISTDVGNARLLPGGITLNSINEMSKKIDYLLTDEKCRLDYASKGKRYAFDNCRISNAVDKLVQIIEKETN